MVWAKNIRLQDIKEQLMPILGAMPSSVARGSSTDDLTMASIGLSTLRLEAPASDAFIEMANSKGK